MEKYAVDLDRVLDEFEFNEDCAEQVASSTDSEKIPSPLLNQSSEVPSNCIQIAPKDSASLTDKHGILLPTQSPECQRTDDAPTKVDALRIDETLAVKKVWSKQENSESINDFYDQGRTVDDKVQKKRYVDFGDGEPVSLTIRNDISQKLVQKRQNESTLVGIKNHNSYDKKLNQPNIKPSVSNVFSSLNDYINAPSGNINQCDNSVARRKGGRVKGESAIKIIDKVDKIAVGENSSSAGALLPVTITSDEPDIPKNERRDYVENLTHAVPEYQNILLPVKFDSDVGLRNKPETSKIQSFSECANLEAGHRGNFGMSLNREGVSGNITAMVAADSVVNSGTRKKQEDSCLDAESTLPSMSINIARNPEPKVSIAERLAEHSYENVYIPSDELSKPSEPGEPKHVYENVDLEEKIMDYDGKSCGYERIYVGEDRDESETAVGDAEASSVDNRVTNSRFQKVKPNAMTERGPVVGFGMTIDDLSEEELNKYLAQLEAEERAIEGKALYENVGSVYDPVREDGMPRRAIGMSGKRAVYDEDANEAPIFEPVMIGELPTVSEEKLQEKAKKFPIIDYSKQQGSSVSIEPKFSDFLDNGPEQFLARARPISEAGVTEERCGESGNGDEKSHDEINLKVAVCETSTEKQENIEPIMADVNAIGKVIYPGELVENIPLNYDIAYEPGNNNSPKDLGTRRIELVENTVDNGNVEFESNDAVEGSVLNRRESETGPEASNIDCGTGKVERSNNCVFTDKNMKPNTGEYCDYSNDESESHLPGLPTSLDNGFNICERSTKDEGSDVEDKPSRPQSLDIVSTVIMDDDTTIGSPGVTPRSQERFEAKDDAPRQLEDHSLNVSDNSSFESGTILGKQPPFWIPDSEAPNCMICDVRFHVIKRRHHCRACGKVLCNKCCSMKYRLEYQCNIDSRVCSPCYQLLVQAEQEHGSGGSTYANSSPSNINSSQGRQPNPNNPMEYCSTIPPLQQLAGGLPPPPTVMVPVGVLKREGSSKQRAEGQKSVMFSDGIRPGCDLTELDTSWDLKPPYRKTGKRTPIPGQISTSGPAKRQNIPPLDSATNCYIPQDPDALPPTVTIHKGQISYHEPFSPASLYKSLKNECEPPIMFAINRNLYAYVKITNLNCCVNRVCWNITSRGLACVGQDEIILLVETLPDETQIPKDLLIHINQIYIEAIKGNTITELGVSIHQGGHFLGSREHAGFIFIRQTFQCLQKIILPPAPFLVGLLVHRWETPWAKVFPLRLMLRLGAEYRYYPCPLVSVRYRDAVYFEIGHTIMKVLADFRNFAYTLPGVRGLTIHMQDRTTDVLFPKNRYDQVIKGLNNSNDHVLAFASNFSVQSDSHLVCIQTNTGDESSYQTQAINIHNKPRKVTGASFVVINGALKSSMGLSAKSSIVEDGLMVQIMPEKMEALKASLKNMHDFSIGCGLQGAPEPDETVNIKWVDNDVQFNLGVKSPIDGKAMDGIPSIRVHNGTDYMGTSRFIRWTEVFIIKSDDHPVGVHDPVDINKLSESIAKATCAAFVKLLDLLATAGLTKLAVRTTIYPDNVGYEAGSEGTRLPPIYMNSLDNELIQVLHKAAQISQDTNTVLELIFHVLDD